MSANRMHRSNRLLRTIMAMLLIVAMTVQQGAYVLADETVPQPVTEASAPQTQAATEKHTEPAAPASQPETTAPETKAPETAAPETKAAETAAPETKAPETAAPETKAAETAAPETAVPETKAPETKAPETAASKSETKAPETASTEKVRENAVSFVVPEGAKVYVDDKDVTNQKGTARDGKIIFKVVPETGYAIASVKVDDTKDARNTHDENEYVIEGIQTDNTVVRVTMNKVETEKTTESETAADVKESETDTGKEYETSFSTTAHNATITATTTDAAKFPEGTQLHVDPMTEGTQAYNEALTAVKASLNLKEDEEFAAGPMYDIYFVVDGQRVEPDASVKVSITFTSPVKTETVADSNIQSAGVYHVDDNGAAEKISNDIQVTGEGEVTRMGFTSTEFSPYVGGLVLKTANQGNSTSVDISNMVHGVKITSPDPDDKGVYQLRAGTNYNVELTFKEDGKGVIQFPNNATPMTYTLPIGFEAVEQSGVFDITVTRNGQTYVVENNSYKIKDGRISVIFNTQDPEFIHLQQAANAEYTLNLSGSFTQEDIEWGQNHSIKVKLDSSHDAGIQKESYFDQKDKKIHYKVKVDSIGTNSGLQITDAMKGDILNLDEKSIAITEDTINWKDKGKPYLQGSLKSSSDKGFVYALPDMVDGEQIVLTYTASVSTNSDSINVKTTAENTVSINDSNGTNPNNNEKTTKTDITFVDMKKTASNVSDVVDGKRTIDWEIDYNTPMIVSVGGDIITDVIQSDNTTYTGDGIYVQRFCRDADGNETAKGDRVLVKWKDITVNENNTKWVWNIPLDDTKPYHYKITYQTVTDVSSLVKDTTVKNDSSGQHKKETVNANASSNVGPEEKNKAAIDKKAISVTSQNITWTATIDVPAAGLSEAILKDSLPSAWVNNGVNNVQYFERPAFYTDTDNGIHISGLVDGETYNITPTPNEEAATGFTVTFYKDSNKTTGLKSTGSKRQITVTYTTVNSEEWVKNAPQTAHTNTVTFDGLNASASATPADGQFKKSLDSNNVITVTEENEVSLPAWKFRLDFTGVTGDIDVDDTFDTNLFKIVPNGATVSQDSWYLNTVNGGDGSLDTWAGHRKENVLTVTATDNGAHFHVNASDLPKNNEKYYPHYRIYYFLQVKNTTALATLNQEAAAASDATVTKNNTASYADASSKVSFSYKYDGVKKTGSVQTVNGINYINYTVQINPGAAKLNNGLPLALNDTFNNNMLSIDPSTILISPNNTSAKVDINGGTLTVKDIPDQTALTLTYKGRVLGNGNITVENTATMGKYKDTTSNQVNQTSGSGTASVTSIYILKYEAGNIEKKLSGATFGLYSSYTDATNNTPVYIDNNPLTVTTDNDGRALIESNSDKNFYLQEGETYYLREIAAPKDYALSDTTYQFTISKDGTPNYEKCIYFSGDTLSVKDVRSIRIPVSKTWNDSNSKARPDSVTLKLQRSTDNTTWTDVSGINGTVTLSASNSASNNWKAEFSSLPATDTINGEDVPVYYRVVEKDVPAGYTVSYNKESISSENSNAVAEGFKVTNTLTKTTTVSITKKWSDNNNQDGLRPSAEDYKGKVHLHSG